MANFVVEAIEDLADLAVAVVGDTANVVQEGLDYMLNEAASWDIPTVVIEVARELFASGDPVPGVSVNGSNGTPSNSSDPQTSPPNSEVTNGVFQFFKETPGDNITVTVDGSDYPVATIEMIATHNAIPYFVLVIDGKAVSGSTTGSIRKPDLGEIQEVRASLSKYIYDHSKPVAFKIQEGTLDGVTQTMEVKEWIISGVGSTQLNAGGGYAISITVSHPLILADVVHTNLFNAKNVKEPAKIDGGSNIKEKVVKTLEKYLEIVGSDVLSVEGIEEADWDKLKGRVKRAVATLNDKLEWNNKGGDDLPFFKGSEVDLTEKLSNYFDTAIWHEVFKATEGNHSPLNTIKALTQGLYGIGLDGGFNDKPVMLSPEIPWGLATATIYDDEISQIALPAIDDLPLAGLVIPYPSKGAAATYNVEATGSDGENVKRKEACAFYVKPALAGQVGAIPYDALPGWLLSYPEYVVQDYDGFQPGDRRVYSIEAEGTTGDRDEVFEDFEKAAKVWALNRFREYFGVGKTCNIGTKLNIGTEWASIYTGDNVEVRSRKTNKPLFYFNVKAIKHIVSPSSSRAATEYFGTHVRPPEGYPSADITAGDVSDGIPNLLYNAIAKFNVSGD